MISNLRRKFAGLVTEEGFTLIELMIVIAIIGILAAIALPKFASVKDTANRAKAESEMKNLQTALEMYYSKNQQYPTKSNLTNMEGMEDSVINTYKDGDTGAGYSTKNGQDDYEWVYNTGDYKITIDSDGVFESN